MIDNTVLDPFKKMGKPKRMRRIPASSQ